MRDRRPDFLIRFAAPVFHPRTGLLHRTAAAARASEQEGAVMIRHAAYLLIILTTLTACSSLPSAGGITIAATDPTPPTASLGAGTKAGGDGAIAVSSGGAAQSMQLTAKTGHLSLLATGQDNESGIQTLEIWVSKKVTDCRRDLCQTSQPLTGAPMFRSSEPKKNPGEKDSESTILAQALDLADEISQAPLSPGDSHYVEFTISCVAVNHLGGRIRTPEIRARFAEKA
ncbi:hypothetical protein ILP97_04880 [Amycolatopsis sp. H6(2020)]|nr:hypothetical protein [Amycolatopsis sp. H6(2020)]